jgi:hypothetical protein
LKHPSTSLIYNQKDNTGFRRPVSGVFVYHFRSKKFSSDALFPELFKENKKYDPLSSPIYASAIYSNGRLISPSSKYRFPISITEDETPKTEFSGKTNGIMRNCGIVL